MGPKKNKEFTNSLATWDITIFKNHNDYGLDFHKVANALNGWCKKWVFQKEECPETKKPHFQCRVSLVKKKRLDEITSQVPLNGHWTPTNKTVHKGQNFNYVMKEDTRIEGPWKDSDYTEPPPFTRQLRYFAEQPLRPWQDDVLKWCEEEDDRSIKMIYDTIGNSGKSIMAEYLEFKEKAFELPPMRVMEDIMQFVYSFNNQKVYLIDMPRAMKKDKLGEFYAGLECLKNGVCYDKRYCGKKRRFDRPQIIVFTNVLPEWSLMSTDRWEAYEMQSGYSLKKLPLEGSTHGAPSSL